MIYGTQTDTLGAARTASGVWMITTETPFPGGIISHIAAYMDTPGTTTQVNFGVFAGGTSNDPNGSILIGETGNQPRANLSADEYNEFALIEPVQVSPGTRLWGGFSNSGANFRGASPADLGDWRGVLRHVTSGNSQGWVSAFPETFDAPIVNVSNIEGLRAFIRYTPVITIGQASETSQVFAFAGADVEPIVGAISAALESNVAFALSRRKLATLATHDENNAALLLDPHISGGGTPGTTEGTIGRASSSETAQPIARGVKIVSMGMATETSNAAGLTGHKTGIIRPANEYDRARRDQSMTKPSTGGGDANALWGRLWQ